MQNNPWPFTGLMHVGTVPQIRSVWVPGTDNIDSHTGRVQDAYSSVISQRLYCKIDGREWCFLRSARASLQLEVINFNSGIRILTSSHSHQFENINPPAKKNSKIAGQEKRRDRMLAAHQWHTKVGAHDKV